MLRFPRATGSERSNEQDPTATASLCQRAGRDEGMVPLIEQRNVVLDFSKPAPRTMPNLLNLTHITSPAVPAKAGTHVVDAPEFTSNGNALPILNGSCLVTQWVPASAGTARGWHVVFTRSGEKAPSSRHAHPPRSRTSACVCR